MNAAIRQQVERAGLFLKARESDKLYFVTAKFNNGCMVQLESALLEKHKCTAQIILSSPDKWVFIAVHEMWIATYITVPLGRVHDCNTVELAEKYSRIRL